MFKNGYAMLNKLAEFINKKDLDAQIYTLDGLLEEMRDAGEADLAQLAVTAAVVRKQLIDLNLLSSSDNIADGIIPPKVRSKLVKFIKLKQKKKDFLWARGAMVWLYSLNTGIDERFYERVCIMWEMLSKGHPYIAQETENLMVNKEYRGWLEAEGTFVPDIEKMKDIKV